MLRVENRDGRRSLLHLLAAVDRVPDAVRDEARVARHRRDGVAECIVEAERVEDRRRDQWDERDAGGRPMSVVALAALAGGQLGGALLGRRPKLATAPVLAEVRQRLDGHLEDVVLVVELGPQPAPDPAGGDAVEEGLLVRVETDALLQDDDGPPEAARLVELVLGRTRVVRADNEGEHVGLGDEVEERALRTLRPRTDELGHQRAHVQDLDRALDGAADGAVVVLDRANEHRQHGDHRTAAPGASDRLDFVGRCNPQCLAWSRPALRR